VIKLVETNISGVMIYMRYADNPDTAKATQWVDFQVPIADLIAFDQRTPLRDVEERYLAETHLAALRALSSANSTSQNLTKIRNTPKKA
jgi:hypothetical protein